MQLFSAKTLTRTARGDPAGGGQGGAAAHHQAGGFTLVEVMVAMAFLTMLMVSIFGSITSMNLISRRSADVISGMELAEAKIHDIRAADYPGTNGIFSATQITTNINSISFALNKAGTTFNIPGTVISTIKPITWGHLVTVTVIVNEPNRSLTNTLQTVVNNYSGGRGQ